MIRFAHLGLVAACGGLISLSALAQEEARPNVPKYASVDESRMVFDDAVHPVLMKHCSGCHSGHPSYGARGHRTISNMYTTWLQLAGSDREFFGQVDTNLAGIETHGPLEELLA